MSHPAVVPADRIAKGMYWGRAWSLVEGCTHCSPGCDHCWSAAATHMRRKNPNPIISERMEGLTRDDGRFNGEIKLRLCNLELPMRTRKPTVWAIWNDLFHESVSEEFQREAFATMQACKDRHRFLILTKRPRIMADRVESNPQWLRWADHIWWGCTVCNQQEADHNLPELRRISGNLYISYEPVLRPVNWERALFVNDHTDSGAKAAHGRYGWIIAGGETGRTARLMHQQWGLDVRDQCEAAYVPLFFKSWGSARETMATKGYILPAMPRELPWKESAHA